MAEDHFGWYPGHGCGVTAVFRWGWQNASSDADDWE